MPPVVLISIRKGIKSLERKNLSVDNGMFKVKVNDTKGVITIDIKHKNGELIDSHTYNPDSVLDEKVIGKS